MTRRRGFILIFSLIMVFLIALLTEQLITGVFVSSGYMKAMLAREQAKLAVLSGLEIARAKLTLLGRLLENKKDEQQKNAEAKDGKDKDDGEMGTEVLEKNDGRKKYLAAILPILNRWQTVVLDEKVDGVAVKIQFCIVCEQGKLNLNEAFDFKKQVFKKEYEQLLKSLEIKGKIPAGEFAKTLQEYLIKRSRKFEDVSELLEIPLLRSLDLFYRPPKPPSKTTEKAEPNQQVTLTDIFTVWSDDETVTPILFSDGLCAIFGFRRPRAGDGELLKERYKQFLTKYSPGLELDPEKNWELFQLIYDQKSPLLKEMQPIFSKEFGPSVYSVLCYATVGEVTQRALAIMKRIALPNEEKEKAGTEEPASKQGKNSSEGGRKLAWTFEIVRLYWL